MWRQEGREEGGRGGGVGREGRREEGGRRRDCREGGKGECKMREKSRRGSL